MRINQHLKNSNTTFFFFGGGGNTPWNWRGTLVFSRKMCSKCLKPSSVREPFLYGAHVLGIIVGHCYFFGINSVSGSQENALDLFFFFFWGGEREVTMGRASVFQGVQSDRVEAGLEAPTRLGSPPSERGGGGGMGRL